MDIRRCNSCGLDLPVSDFYDRRNGGPGRWCKPCARARSKAWREANVEKYKATQRRHVPIKRQVRREREYLTKYGITISRYNEMVMMQCGLCAVCGGPPTGPRDLDERLAVHHCHDTGTVIALVCSPCNLGMGQLGDDPERMRFAASLMETARGSCGP